MPTLTLTIRDLLDFPRGANASDTLINGVHFNTTALRYFNYTYYSNHTLSNNSKCYLVFDKYKPIFFDNGTWVNATSCYDPVNRIGRRASVGMAFATMFGMSIMFILVNLRKHGSLHLPVSKKFAPVGRRWMWYWMLALAACGTISGFMAVDVDRNYLQHLAITLQSFFFYLMAPIMLATVWESVRHWGAWQERQIYDIDKYAFDVQSTREKQEFYLPLIFYLWTFMNFFMTVPRSWTAMQKQRSPSQTTSIAKPASTDTRFKVGAIFTFLSLLTIVYSLIHSIYRYKTHPRNTLMRYCFYPLAAPLRFILCIACCLVRCIYGAAAAWSWTINPVKYNGDPAVLYCLGYLPPLLIIIILNTWGLLEDNEDKQLIRQRARVELENDNELGIDRRAAKPAWWMRMRPDFHPGFGHDANGKLRTLVTHVGGGKPTQDKIAEDVEMESIQKGKEAEERRREVEEDYFSVYRQDEGDGEGKGTPGGSKYFVKGSTMLETPERAASRRSSTTRGMDSPRPLSSRAELLPNVDARSNNSRGTSVSNSVAAGNPQTIRSMLDI